MVESGIRIGISTFLRQRELVKQALGANLNVDLERRVVDIATPDYCIFLRTTKNRLTLEARDFRTDAGVIIENVTGLEVRSDSVELSDGNMTLEAKRERGIVVRVKPSK